MEIGDIVICTKQLKNNPFKEGMIGILITMDSYDLVSPFEVDHFDARNESRNNWCNDVRLATKKEIANSHLKKRGYKDVKIGDTIKVIAKPAMWSSRFGHKNPMDTIFKFPYYFQVRDFIMVGNEGVAMGVAMGAEYGNFGWFWELSDTCFEITSKTEKIRDSIEGLPHSSIPHPLEFIGITPMTESLSFPNNGWCQDINMCGIKALRFMAYLRKEIGGLGIAWNSHSYWPVNNYSLKDEYSIDFLLTLKPFKNELFSAITERGRTESTSARAFRQKISLTRPERLTGSRISNLRRRKKLRERPLTGRRLLFNQCR